MLRSRVLVPAAVAVLAVLPLGLAVGHRLGDAGTARAVVRKTLLVTLDPDAPDFEVIEPGDRLEGSACKVIPLPGLTRRAQASFVWNDLRALRASEHPGVQGLWRFDPLAPVTYARDGEVLVELRAAFQDGRNHSVTAGANRLTVDMVE